MSRVSPACEIPLAWPRSLGEHRPVPELRRLRADHAAAVLAFELRLDAYADPDAG